MLNPFAQDASESMTLENDAARKKYLVQAVLAMMSMALGVFTVLIALGWVANVFDLQAVTVMVLIDAPIGISWWLAHHGHWRWASWTAPAVMFALAVYGSSTAGLVNSLLLFYVIAIFLTGLLQYDRAQWIVLGLAIIAHFATNVIFERPTMEDLVTNGVTVSGSFLGITLLQQFSMRQWRRALAQATSATESLRAEMAERKQAEQAIRASEDKFSKAFRTSPDSVNLNRLSDGLFLEINQGFTKLTGYTAEDVRGKTSLEIDVWADPQDRERLVNGLREQGQVTNLEAGFRLKDGQVKTGLMSARIIQVDGEPCIISMTRDISERKQAEQEREKLIQELEKRNAELERFTYTVSHDLKSPLITIQGFLGFVEQDAQKGDRERLRTDMAHITEATKKMSRLLNELLELSRIGRLTNPPEAVPFNDIVRDAILIVRGQLTAKNVAITVAENLPVVHGDRVRLVEVAQNLIDNAIKFMGDQPRPCIEIGQRGTDPHGKPIFFVRDNGMGIDPKYHANIFGLFNKLDAQTEGTGVGLALVKRIIEVHGGKIWVESESGKGATFLFSIGAQKMQ